VLFLVVASIGSLNSCPAAAHVPGGVIALLGQPRVQVLAPRCGVQTGACSAMDARCWHAPGVAALATNRRRPQLVLLQPTCTSRPIVWPAPGLPNKKSRVLWISVHGIEAWRPLDGHPPLGRFPRARSAVACEPHQTGRPPSGFCDHSSVFSALPSPCCRTPTTLKTSSPGQCGR